MKRGDLVQIVNPKHKFVGRLGVLSNMDRGNVYVKLLGAPAKAELVCLRMNALAPAGALDQLARVVVLPT